MSITATITIVDRDGNNDTRSVKTSDIQSFMRQLSARGGSIEHIQVPAGTPHAERLQIERITSQPLSINLGV